MSYSAARHVIKLSWFVIQDWHPFRQGSGKACVQCASSPASPPYEYEPTNFTSCANLQSRQLDARRFAQHLTAALGHSVISLFQENSAKLHLALLTPNAESSLIRGQQCWSPTAKVYKLQTLYIRAQFHDDVGRGMVVPPSGTDKRCEPLPPGLLHHYVQRFGMVCEVPHIRHGGACERGSGGLGEEAMSLHWNAICAALYGPKYVKLANKFWLHSDYINPIDLCNRLNTYIVPEAAVHGFLTSLFLINGYWIALVLNLPLLAFNAKK